MDFNKLLERMRDEGRDFCPVCILVLMRYEVLKSGIDHFKGFDKALMVVCDKKNSVTYFLKDKGLYRGEIAGGVTGDAVLLGNVEFFNTNYWSQADGGKLNYFLKLKIVRDSKIVSVNVRNGDAFGEGGRDGN